MKTVIKTSIGRTVVAALLCSYRYCAWPFRAFSCDASRQLLRRTAAIPGRTQRRGKALFCISLAALTTQQLAGPHWVAMPPATSTPPVGAGALACEYRRRKYGHGRRGAFEQHHRQRQYG